MPKSRSQELNERYMRVQAIEAEAAFARAAEKRFNLDAPMDVEFRCAKCGEWTHGSEAFGGDLCSGCAHEYAIQKHLTAEAIRNNTPYPSPFDIKVIAEAAIPDATAYFIGGSEGQIVKMENIGKTARANLEKELLNGRFLEGMLHAIKQTGHDPRQLQNVVEHIERIVNRLQTERGTASADMVRVRAEEKRIFDAAQDAILKLNTQVQALESALKAEKEGRRIDQAQWDATYKEMLDKLTEAQAEVQPRRLQAKVREQWPTIESELQWFLEWLVEEKGYVANQKRIDVRELVAQYVAATKEDGNDG